MKTPFVTKAQVEEIAKTYPTPFHIYDEKGIRENARKLKQAFAWNKGYKEYFAVKATPNPTILKILKEEGCGTDCSSYTELLMSEKMGITGSDIMFSSNDTPAEEFVLAKKLGANINLDDYTHVQFLKDTCGVPETVFCRYNPGGTFSISTTIMDNPGDAKYGMTKEQLFKAYTELRDAGAKKFGLHSFLASNTVTNDYYPTLAKILFEVAVELKEKTGIKLSYINLSGGVGIPYTPDKEGNDILKIGEGVYAKDSATGKYMSFTGNMSGMLIAEYILSEKKAKGILPKNGALIKTIVTTNLADVVAKEYNVKLIEVLTGFKYIGEQIKLFERNHSYEYVFGFEESYGCLVGTHARDKDAIVAVMMLCEAAAYYKKHGLTLWDQMLRIYEKYGYFKETLVSITKKGKEGLAEIQGMLDKLRSNPPKEIGGYKVLETRDYNNNTVTKADGTVTETGLPKSNVLYFDLEDNAWCCARPSGTEPKIKFYMGVKGNSFDDADAKLEKLKNDMMAIVE